MSFGRAFDLLMLREGGFVDDPKDTGGVTKYGISLHAYPHLGYEGIKNLTREQARALYLQDYWSKIRGDDLPDGLALCVFDYAVNSGVGAAIRLLQQAVQVPVDGALGPITLAAMKRIPERELIEHFSTERLLLLTTMSGWPRFRRGWTRRVVGMAMEAVS